MPMLSQHTYKVRGAGIDDEDLRDRDFDDLLRRAADFLKNRPSPAPQDRTQKRESPQIEERDSDA